MIYLSLIRYRHLKVISVVFPHQGCKCVGSLNNVYLSLGAVDVASYVELSDSCGVPKKKCQKSSMAGKPEIVRWFPFEMLMFFGNFAVFDDTGIVSSPRISTLWGDSSDQAGFVMRIWGKKPVWRFPCSIILIDFSWLFLLKAPCSLGGSIPPPRTATPQSRNSPVAHQNSMPRLNWARRDRRNSWVGFRWFYECLWQIYWTSWG